VLGVAFWMSEQHSLGADSTINFNEAMDLVPFLRGKDPDLSVERRSLSKVPLEEKGPFHRVDASLDEIAAGVRSGEGDAEVQEGLEIAVENMKDSMLAFTSVLREIEDAILRACDPDTDGVAAVKALRKSIEDIMYTPRGHQLNEHVLAPFACELVWTQVRGQRVLRSPPVPWQPKLDTPPAEPSYHEDEKTSAEILSALRTDEFDGIEEPSELILHLDKITHEAQGAMSSGDQSPCSDDFPSYNPSPIAPHSAVVDALNGGALKNQYLASFVASPRRMSSRDMRNSSLPPGPNDGIYNYLTGDGNVTDFNSDHVTELRVEGM
jgi:hypothetical protein